MADPSPRSRPEAPPNPAGEEPSVYGGRWGKGDAAEAEPTAPDRPSPISTPKESPGWPDPENSAPTSD